MRESLEERVEGNGQTPDVPPGGRQVHPDLILYTTPGGHRYLHLPTRTWLKGLTRILQNLPPEMPLLRWIANQGGWEQYQEALTKAGKRGSGVHMGIEDLLQGKRLNRNEFDPEVWRHLQSWMNWYEDYAPVTVAIEQPVFDLRRKIATMLDWRGGVRPPDKRGKQQGEMQHTYLDWKSSSGIWESAVLQVHEGAWMYNNGTEKDEHGEIEQVGVVRTGANTKRGYEYQAADLRVDAERHKYNHKIVDCLLWLEHHREPEWEPKFPPDTPRHLQLPEE